MSYKKVKIIESLDLYLRDKIDLLLVYAHQKPATTIDVFDWNNYDADTGTCLHSQKKLSETIRKLNKLNLAYKVEDLDRFEASSGEIFGEPDIEMLIIERTPINIAANCENLERLLHAYKTGDEYEFGRMYGFPETAIQAYHGERPVLMTFLDSNNPEDFFTSFIFSADFFKEEYISTSLRWYNTVKRLSPKLMKEIEEYQKIPPCGEPLWR